MIADARNFDEYDREYEVAFRQADQPTRLRVALSAKLAGSGKQKQANAARFDRRARGAAPIGGAHRRREKRSYL